MQLDTTSITQLAVPVGCLVLGGWQFIRANKCRQRLANYQAQHRDELHQREKHLAETLLGETGTQSVPEFIGKWRQLNYRLGYALHHIEDFNAAPLLKQQLVTIASRLRMHSKQNAHYRPLHSGPQTGGFRKVGGESESEVEWEVEAVVDGLDNWQLASICCAIMDGYSLEGAFAKLGITVLSPDGKAMALGEKCLNPYGARLQSAQS